MLASPKVYYVNRLYRQYETIQTRRVWLTCNDDPGGNDLPRRSPRYDADQGNLAARANLLQIPRTNSSYTQECRTASQQDGRWRRLLPCPSRQRDHPRADLSRAGWTCSPDQMCKPDGL